MSKHMEYKDTDKVKGQLLGNKDIKLSFLKKEYEINKEKGETTCRLTCKINLSDFEKKCFKFSDKVKRMIVDGLMSTYMLYSTEPKVYYDKKDGKRVQVIAQESKKEYNYFDSFTVKATVKVQDGDVFDETTGKILSESKAKIKAYRKAYYLFVRLSNMFYDLSEAFSSYSDDMETYGYDEDTRYADYAGIEYPVELWDDEEEADWDEMVDDIDSDLDEMLEKDEQ